MRRLLLITVVLSVTLLSCLKQDKPNCSAITATAPANEIAALKKYIDSNHIDAVADSRGFYYKITAAGTGAKPTVCSYITATYTGKFTSGATFQSGPLDNYSLSGLITGWQEGIPLISSGGAITLYLPPSLAYGPDDVRDGDNGPVIIPGGSILIFEIGLTSFH